MAPLFFAVTPIVVLASRSITHQSMNMSNTGPITIRLAAANDSEVVGDLVCRLLCEIVPDKYSLSDEGAFTITARTLLADDNGFWVVIAFHELADGVMNPVALMSLDEGRALYAHDCLGEIMELYIDPIHRSAGLGARMIEFAITFGRKRGWSILEVGAPDVPRWQRTVDFYLRCGFGEVGPRLYMEL